MLPIPYCCIWCLNDGPDVEFDVSHVVPECVGNDSQVLPEGFICKPCNQFFGRDIERTLLRDPTFHIHAVHLRMVDPDDSHVFRDCIFDEEHPPVWEPIRSLDLKVNITGNKLTLDFTHQIQGRIAIEYDRRHLAFLSRAIHKIAFETLTWTIFVKGGMKNPPDVFSGEFNSVREWVRRGEPQNSVRAVLRRDSGRVMTKWGSLIYRKSLGVAVGLNLFGDWYGVSLTTKATLPTDQFLSQFDIGSANDFWCFADEILTIGE